MVKIRHECYNLYQEIQALFDKVSNIKESDIPHEEKDSLEYTKRDTKEFIEEMNSELVGDRYFWKSLNERSRTFDMLRREVEKLRRLIKRIFNPPKVED